MDAKKCDRCGAYYEEKSTTYNTKFEIVTLNGSNYSRKKYDTTATLGSTMLAIAAALAIVPDFDLCPVCFEKLQKFLLNENPDIVDVLTKKPDKTLSESLEEKLALPIEGAPNGPATDCKYCGRMINRRKDVRACLNTHISSHPHCTYKCTKFEPKEEEE